MVLAVLVFTAAPLLWLMALHDGVVEHVLWGAALLLLVALYDPLNPEKWREKAGAGRGRL